ncbi:MAG: hypothetical protein R2695_04180 [Acidimicrobiales bacterium]
MAGYRVVSGVRSYQMQKSLFSGWRKKLAGLPGFEHYNQAADPDRLIGTSRDGIVFRGSTTCPSPTGRATPSICAARSAIRSPRRLARSGQRPHLRPVPDRLRGEVVAPAEPAPCRLLPRPGLPTLTDVDQEEDDMRCPLGLSYDEKAKRTRVHVVGEGSTLVDDPAHWVEVVKRSHETRPAADVAAHGHADREDPRRTLTRCRTPATASLGRVAGGGRFASGPGGSRSTASIRHG